MSTKLPTITELRKEIRRRIKFCENLRGKDEPTKYPGINAKILAYKNIYRLTFRKADQ